MKLVAEYVGIGHPDRLADAVVTEIVSRVISRDSDALCGLECSIFQNQVYITGRIAAGRNKSVIDSIEIEKSVRTTYTKCGYYGIWHPTNEEIIVIQNIIIEPLSNEERKLRNFSDDQSVVTGYAVNCKETNYFPIAHYVALTLGQSFSEFSLQNSNKYGTDLKILVTINKDGNNISWNSLVINIRHIKGLPYEVIFNDVKHYLDRKLKQLFEDKLPGLATIENKKIVLNYAGEFYNGGPIGDNGLSGKKLVIDFYGPDVPIGGGAIYGKDPHKVDVCGAYIARLVALNTIKQTNCSSVFVKVE